jgi:hypothetical protein
MRRARTILVALAAAMLLAGCIGSNGGAPSVPTTAPPRTNLQPEVEAATCRDKAGDGKPADIRSVALSHVDDRLVIRFELTARPPTAGTALWVINAASPSGGRALQLGVKFLDGKQIAHFTFDFGSAQQQNLTGAVSLAGTVLTAEFPYDAVAGLGETWKWSATTNVQGDDVDDCPDEGVDSLNPRTESFPTRPKRQ